MPNNEIEYVGSTQKPAIIVSNNVNGALMVALSLIKKHGVLSETRNSTALVLGHPIITHYENPRDRVLFSSVRDANPFFHFMEGLWMLAGRKDVEFLQLFNSNIGQFSDDGKILNGAYGYRWRENWGVDQIKIIIEILRKEPTSRRAVLEMWSVSDLTNQHSKDLPCNTHIYFDLRGGALNMTICNRSNDTIWGCYGANVVHFSILQEYIASMVEVKMGWYCQFSNNLHIYTNIPNFDKLMSPEMYCVDHYKDGILNSRAMFDGLEEKSMWDKDLKQFLLYVESNKTWSNQTNAKPYVHSFFSLVAEPLFHAWLCYKDRDLKSAITEHASCIQAEDWKLECMSWLQRRVVSKCEDLNRESKKEIV